MKEKLVTNAEARRFLLGDVDDSERQRIETLFISDPESNERILLAEGDLFEDYFENSLTSADRNRFLEQYGSTPRQRRKLRIARSVKDYALAGARISQPVISTTRRWDTFLAGLRSRNRGILIPVAAVLIIVFVVAGVWLIESGRRAQDNDRRVAIEQELARLNLQPGELPSKTLSVVLPPVSVRSVQPQNQIEPGPDTPLVELQLVWIQKQYSGYRATVRRIGNADQYTIPNLHIEKREGSVVVPLRLTARLLTPGLYQVSLSGIESNGTPSPTEEYTFTIGG